MASPLISSQDYETLLKYPRTAHLEGSRLQPGDEGSGHTPFSALEGLHIVSEEKLDAANAGISFNGSGDLLLQCRGHYLTGGGRERQFNLFKRWAQAHESRFLERLEDRYIVYGEWMHKLHSVFYNALPHFFLEFDVWDRVESCFLDTPSRHALLKGLPILSVPVLSQGPAPKKLNDLPQLHPKDCGRWSPPLGRPLHRQHAGAWRGHLRPGPHAWLAPASPGKRLRRTALGMTHFETAKITCPYCDHKYTDDDMSACETDLWGLAPEEGSAEVTCPTCAHMFWVQGGYRPHFTSAQTEDAL